MNSQGVLIIVSGSMMYAPETGDNGSLTLNSEERCTLKLSGVVYSGWLRGDGSIVWTDGDVWVLRNTDTAEAQGELRSLERGGVAHMHLPTEKHGEEVSDAGPVAHSLATRSAGCFDGPWRNCQ